jgi:GNAT superfamily N-acetyltransferase
MLWREGDYEIDTEPSRIDFNRVYAYLRTTYWANDRSFDAVRASWKHSHLVFGVYANHLGALQIGCARVVTDTYSFGWLADVFIDPDFRGKGLGKFLMRCVVEHPDCRDLKLFILGTRDAHGLYEQFGWEKPRHPERFLIRYNYNE